MYKYILIGTLSVCSFAHAFIPATLADQELSPAEHIAIPLDSLVTEIKAGTRYLFDNNNTAQESAGKRAKLVPIEHFSAVPGLFALYLTALFHVAENMSVNS